MVQSDLQPVMAVGFFFKVLLAERLKPMEGRGVGKGSEDEQP